METIFLRIYDFFKGRRALLFFLFFAIVVLLSWSALRLSLDQDLMSLIPHNGEDRRTEVFENLKVKDKVLVMIHKNDTLSIKRLCEISDNLACVFEGALYGKGRDTSTDKVFSDVYFSNANSEIDETIKFIQSNSSLYSNIENLDSITSDSFIAKRMKETYEALYSPFGSFSAEYNFQDPFGLSFPILKQMKSMQISDEYCFFNNHLFLREDTTALIVLSPSLPAHNIDSDETIVKLIEGEIAKFPGVEIDYFGGPAIAAYNSWQVQKDLNSTLFIALGIILLVILFAFRNKKSVFLILIPGVFGFLFALGIIACVKESISLIAIGASSAIVGVVLSYSIHVVCHGEHCKDVRQLISEMSSPLTVGSFTTIGAFFSLVFTSSSLLQDFGLLASLTIVGASLYCLVILPHQMKVGEGGEPTRLYKFVERISDYHFENSKALLAVVVILSLLGLWWANDCAFNADMDALCYQPKKFRKADERLLKSVTSQDSCVSIYFVATGKSYDEALEAYEAMNNKLSKLKKDSIILRHSYCPLIPSTSYKLNERQTKWNNFWTDEKIESVRKKFKTECKKCGLPADAFDYYFKNNIKVERQVHTNDIPIHGRDDWFTKNNDLYMAMANIELRAADKEKVYSCFEEDEKVVILDKPHFISQYVESVKDDFYFVLYVSSFIVFFALLLNYGCLETAILSFLPMAMSYLIILCFMHLFGIEFNIVSVIISTFIFGIGDDFSIFITDGLIEEYRSGRKMFSAHKTAIFFSAFVSIVGMGALIFAEHPSMKSVAQSSLIGMLAVVVIAYTVQPFIFKHLVTNRTKKGLPPITILSTIWTLILLGTFFTMGIVLSIVALLIQIIPMPRIYKTNFLHYMIYLVCSTISVFGRGRFKIEKHNPTNEDFSKPAMILANHQSVLDIVRILALTPKIVIMAKKGNWNSPLYGLLLHLSGFFCSDDSLETTTPKLQKLVDKGYSVCVFPEGTRSANGDIDKFKSGAFYLAQALRLDLVQIIFAGHFQAINRNDIIYPNPAVLSIQILPREPFAEYSPRKMMLQSEKNMKKVYAEERERINTLTNPYYKHILSQNVIFKGPILEHYTKIKLNFEKCYEPIISLIGRDDKIVDLGCGYGYVSFLISLLYSDAKITAVDYDEEKITVAKHCYIGKKIDFICANVNDYSLPIADTYIMSDMLHYLNKKEQEDLLKRIISILPDKGKIIIRDADASDQKRHKMTRLSEWFSTSWLLSFNKKETHLSYFTADDIKRIIAPHNLSLNIIKANDGTSNVVYCVEKV